MFKILVIVAIIIAIAKFPTQTIELGNKAIRTVVTVAGGTYEVGKTTTEKMKQEIVSKR